MFSCRNCKISLRLTENKKDEIGKLLYTLKRWNTRSYIRIKFSLYEIQICVVIGEIYIKLDNTFSLVNGKAFTIQFLYLENMF